MGQRARTIGVFGSKGVVLSAALGAIVLLAGACSSDRSTADRASEPATETTAPAPAPCDVGLNPVGYYEDAELAGVLSDDHAGMDMGEQSGSADEMDMDGGGTDGEEETGEPMDMSGGLGELEASGVIVELNQLDDTAYEQWLQSLDPTREVDAPDDTGRGGHLGPQSWSHVTDERVCGQLTSELDDARAVAARYPKASDAQAAGYRLVAPYLAGIASHWMNFGLIDDQFDVNQPEMLLYDGNTDNANLVGLSYFIRAPGDAEPTVGFTGDNDHYHRHEGLCLRDNVVVGDTTMTAEECEAIGGRKSDGGSGWMSHAWIVPGCASPWGVFSAQNPILDQSLGESSGQGGPCSGSEAAQRWDLAPANDN